MSGKRWRADWRARAEGEGGRGRVDWWSCLLRMRVRREEERRVVSFRDGFLRGGGVLAEVAVRGRFWAVMAPALRSERRSWPFEWRGASLEREAQGGMGWRGRVDMKVEAETLGGFALLL